MGTKHCSFVSVIKNMFQKNKFLEYKHKNKIKTMTNWPIISQDGDIFDF